MKVVTSINLTASEPIETGKFNIVKILKLSTILNAVCEVNNVCVFDVKSDDKLDELVTSRREYCYLACKLTQLTKRNRHGNSLERIGSEINKSGGLVLYHEHKILQWLEIPGYKLKEKFEMIENQLKI